MIATTFYGRSIKLVRVTTRYSCNSSHLSSQHLLGKHESNMWNMFKVNNRRRSGIFIVNFEQISHIVLLFSPLTLNKQISAGLGRNLTILNHHSSFYFVPRKQYCKSLFKISGFLQYHLGCIDKKLTAFGR